MEMLRLLSRHGCEPIAAPSMREVALHDQREALAFGETLLGSGCAVLVLLTGVGTRLLVDALCTRWSREQVVTALGQTKLVCRGSKAVAAVKSLGLRPFAVAAEPNTWHELVPIFDQDVAVSGQDVFVQEYGRPSAGLCQALSERGARVHTVPVYGWALPDDLAPLQDAIERMCAGGADAVLFSSARQSDHLFKVAAHMGRQDALRKALRERVLVVSVGPVTSEALLEHQLPVDLVPEHPKMGQMVIALAEQGARLLAQKRAAHPAADGG